MMWQCIPLFALVLGCWSSTPKNVQSERAPAAAPPLAPAPPAVSDAVAPVDSVAIARSARSCSGEEVKAVFDGLDDAAMTDLVGDGVDASVRLFAEWERGRTFDADGKIDAKFTAESHGVALDVFDVEAGTRTISWSSDFRFAR